MKREQLKEKLLYYDIIPTTYRQNTSVVFREYCNGFEIVNTGATLATINGRPLYPGVVGSAVGDSYTVGGNKGEIFKGRVDIAFPNGAGEVIFTQKIYVQDLIRDLQDSI